MDTTCYCRTVASDAASTPAPLVRAAHDMLLMIWPTRGLMAVHSSSLLGVCIPLCLNSLPLCLFPLMVLLATILWATRCSW